MSHGSRRVWVLEVDSLSEDWLMRLSSLSLVGRGRGFVSALSVIAVVAFCLAGSSSALATTGYGFAGAFGAAGTDPGQFAPGGPSGVAVDLTSGDVLVVDAGHVGGDGVTPEPRVERFAADGTYVSSIAVDGVAYGQLGGVAVDAAGAVYVSAFDNVAHAGTVLKYSAAGSFVHAVSIAGSGTVLAAGGPVAIDPSDGTVYTLASDSISGAPLVDRFDGSTGAFVSSFDGTDGSSAFVCPSGLAVDGNSQVYVVDQSCSNAGLVMRYSATGTFGVTLDAASVSAAAVTADPVSDEVWVAGYPFSGAPPVVQGYDAGGALGQSFGPPQIGGLGSLAINGTSGAVYVTDPANTVVQHYTTFDGPTVTTTAATSVGTVSATLNGTIDPDGVSSTYHFEYGFDTSYGSQTAESDPLTGTGAVAATAPAAGLNPNTTYHFRIVGTNASGSITGNDQTFTTDPAPPVLDGSPAFASAITTSGATLNATLNPNGSATSFHFEYGTDTTYGTSTASTDAGAGVGDQPVTADLTGLTAGTTYHFRLVADNGTGGVQHGADAVFSTAPGTPPSASDVSVFGATLNGVINPHGNGATYHFDYGTTTTYGRSTAETDSGSGSADLAVSQVTGRLVPDTTYHVRLVTTIGGQTTTSDDARFTTGAMPVAVATGATGVTPTQATVGGTVDAHGKDGSYRFFVDALDGSYSTITDARPVPAGDGPHGVSAALSGLPAGANFRVILSVTSNGGTTASEQVVFSTAALQTPPAPPPVGANGPYGCGAPVLNAYNQHPKPGDTITITGSDLGIGGTVVLGGTPIAVSGWSAFGFSLQIPDEAAGALALTVNCGKASNTIAIAIYQAPDNRFTITKSSVKGTVATLTLKLPGAGKVTTTTAAHTASKTTKITKAGTRTVKVALTKAGNKALNKAKARKLKVTVRVTYTPAGGTAATKTKTLTFKRKAGHR
jgi:hypothetical protein